MAARGRWKILAHAIARSKAGEASGETGDVVGGSAESVRSFQSFNLFSTHLIEDTPTEIWSAFHLKSEDKERFSIDEAFELLVRLEKPNFSMQELMGFNNTGNVCIWPAEEVMAFHSLKNPALFHGKSVCELGAGATGLAGLMVAAMCSPASVHLTDGNARSAANLQVCVDRNASMFSRPSKPSPCLVTTAQLSWGGGESSFLCGERSNFDVVLCADCLFFTETHAGLIELLKRILAPTGIALFFAPRRGDTLDRFVGLARDQFSVLVEEDCDPDLTALLSKHSSDPLFKADLHYPLRLTITHRA